MSFSPSETDLPTCAPGIRIEADHLGDEEPTCQVGDATLVFPDGTEMQLDVRSGASGSEPGDRHDWHYAWFNVADYGGVAARYRGDDCAEYEEWGHPAALRKLADAFGSRPGSWTCTF